MARKRRLPGWSFAEDRRVVELAEKSKSVEEIASLMNRKPETIRKVAIRLGVSLRKAAGRSIPTERVKGHGSTNVARTKAKGK
jgi:hypothetical protein